MIYERSIEDQIRRILQSYRKMAFVSGPRQVGKTTLARTLLRETGQGLYFSWDDLTDQKTLVKDPYFYEKRDRNPSRPFLVAFDEIYKYRKWKSYLKGVFDRDASDYSFLVTGSGRLDLYSRGADSLMGRYFGIPLFPLSTGELVRGVGTYKGFLEALGDPPEAGPEAADAFSRLNELNGFPEPFSRGEASFLSVWSAQRMKLLVREDIRDATALRQLSMLEILTHLLTERVGSPLSVSSLREDLGVAFETVRDWIAILHQFYFSFPLMPFSRSLARAIQKAAKVYLFDWAAVPDEAAKFENNVAHHLHKAVSLWSARGEGKTAVRYIRDKEMREVDFVITEDEKPVCLVECKLSDTQPSAPLLYFQKKLKVPTVVQLVRQTGVCRRMRTEPGFAWVVSADRWLSALP